MPPQASITHSPERGWKPPGPAIVQSASDWIVPS